MEEYFTTFSCQFSNNAYLSKRYFWKTPFILLAHFGIACCQSRTMWLLSDFLCFFIYQIETKDKTEPENRHKLGDGTSMLQWQLWTTVILHRGSCQSHCVQITQCNCKCFSKWTTWMVILYHNMTKPLNTVCDWRLDYIDPYWCKVWYVITPLSLNTKNSYVIWAHWRHVQFMVYC